jgi:hypothetical protein
MLAKLGDASSILAQRIAQLVEHLTFFPVDVCRAKEARWWPLRDLLKGKGILASQTPSKSTLKQKTIMLANVD